MATFLRTLFDYSATELSLTKGTNFHEGYFPAEEADDGTALLERVGMDAEPYNTALEYHRIQIVSRSKSRNTAKVEADRVFDWLHKLRGIQLTGWYLYDVIGTRPGNIGQDDKDRWMFSANVTISVKKET